MRILYITEATGWSGGANQIWLTSQELIRRGHQIAVACRPYGDLASRLQKSAVPIFPLSLRQDYDFISAYKLSQIARDFKADLLHAHHPKSHAIAMLATYFMKPLPLVVTRRVIYPIHKNPFSALKYRSKRITRFVAVCNKIAEELITAGVERERITVIPSAVEMHRWEAMHDRRSALKDKRPYSVIMVGHYSKIKGHEIFLKAAARVLKEVPNTKFRIAGRGKDELQEMAAKLNIANHVEILGERSDIPELLSQAHLYVMPSLMEGIGTALIEAQAAKVPVVASEVGGLPDVVDKNETGFLVPPGDDAVLADTIIRTLQHPDEAEKMVVKGYEKVKKKFSLRTVVDQLEELYKSCIK